MWRAPKLQDVEAPSEFKELMNKSVFYNRKGELNNAGRYEVFQYTIAMVFLWLFSTVGLLVIFSLISPVLMSTIVRVIVSIVLFIAISAYFYWWGWLKYNQAWYHFNDDDMLFTIIQKQNDNWEMIEVPYEQVDQIEWSGGDNGFAIIHAAGLTFRTTRADSDRFASVTELWGQLAKFDTYMKNWPITLVCPVCDREFGHHIGTAMCPFDEVILIDPNTKGRIDRENLHPDDYYRV